MTIRIHGIRNCDTMKKAFAWLDAAGVAYEFHDYKKAGIDPVTLARWCEAVGQDGLINRRSTTWRKLPPQEQELPSQDAAIALMQAHTSVIRRPVVETADGTVVVGFDADAFTRHCRST